MTLKEAYRKCLIENSRILELEKIIATDPEYSYLYAFNIIRVPWEKGENSISKHPAWSYKYANYIIKGPFEKCHAIIFDSFFKYDYLKFLSSVNYDLNKISELML